MGNIFSNAVRKKISDSLKGKMPKFIPVRNKGYKHTEETKRKISKTRMGMKNSEEVRIKISKALLGRKFPEEVKRKMSLSHIGKESWNKGKKCPHTEETKRKLSISHRGDKCNFWKGGVTLKNKIIRRGIEFRLWREAVFARDNWTCQKYGIKGGELHPHHILNFSQYPELRFAIDNGITLSKKAHKEFHKKYSKVNNTREQLEEFIYGK